MTEIELASGGPPALAPHVVGRDRNPYWSYLARLDSSESRRTMQRCLDRIAAMLIPPPGCTRDKWPGEQKIPAEYGESVPWHLLLPSHSSVIRAELNAQVERSGISPDYADKHLAALRGVIREAWRHGYIDADQRDRINDIKTIKATRLPAGRDIPLDEFTAILVACDDDTVLGIRDGAIIAALQSTGARRAEISGMLIEQYNRGARSIKIIGKGNKQRTVYFHPEAFTRIDRWLAEVGERRGPIFRAVGKGGRIDSRPLAPRSVGRIVDNRRKLAGLPPLTTHDWRRTFVGDVLDASGDLGHAQALAGHSSPVTTGRYDRRPDIERRAIVDKLTVQAMRERQANQAASSDRPWGIPGDGNAAPVAHIQRT